MKKIVLIICCVAVGALIAFKVMKKEVPATRYTVGILQTASHPALDAVREGFVEILNEKLHGDVTVIVQNAQGSVSTAHTIAQQFHANKQVQAIFAIATPAAQAMSAVEKEKPLIIAAVTDPQALGLIYPGTNVCGVTDAINVSAEIDMLVQLVPAARTVGLLYTSGETNSLVMAKQMRQELEARGLAVTDFAMSSESDVQAIAQLACRKVDVILAPTDNMVASTIVLTTMITQKHKRPFIVSDNMLVAAGPLAARGVDYRASGKQAAVVACEVLVEGKEPAELPIEQAANREVFINQATLHMLGLTIPGELQDDVVFVS